MEKQHRIFLLTLLFILLPLAKPDLGSERAALLALRAALGGRTLLWNVTQQNPCNWTGVQCEDSHVTVLRLPGVALYGQIPNGVLGNLTHIRTLSLRLNALTGQLPSDLASLVNLRNLYLQRNLLSGAIPDVLFMLPDLVRVNLASNNFSGSISPSFNNLTRLGTLFLENNHLSGSIPDLDLENLEQFNVSDNLLTPTKSYDALVSDLGLAQLVFPSSKPTRVAGYRAPEVTDPRKVSQKADIYSFGVLLLELLTGKAPAHSLLNEEGIDLPRYVQSIVREEWTSEVFDPELLSGIQMWRRKWFISYNHAH